MRYLCLLMLIALGTSAMPSQAAEPMSATIAGPAQGVVTVTAPSGPDVTTTSTGWVDMPQMRTRVALPDAGQLAVTLCAEADVIGGGRMFVRGLIDDLAMEPGNVVFAAGITMHAHCFTFVTATSPGPHTIRIQWLVDSGNTGSLGDRTMRVTFARPDAADLRLLAIAAPSGADQVLTGGGWAAIPDLNGTLATPATGDLAITFSAEAYTTNTRRMFVRAVVDGQPAAPSDAVVVVGGFVGTRSFTVVVPGLGAGQHTVALQWLVDAGGDGHLGDRTLTATWTRQTDAQVASQLTLAAPSGATQSTTSSTWTALPHLSGTLDVPVAGDLSVTIAAEIFASNTARVFVRALVDGVPMSPSDVGLTRGGLSGTHTFTFVQRGIERGTHTIAAQWHTDPGETAYVGDRTLSALTTAHQRPVLFIAMESERGAAGYPYGGYYAASVVDTIGTTRVFKPYVRERLFGAFPSVADYFREVSDGRLFMVEGGLLGPYTKQYTEIYYRTQIPDPFTTMQIEARQRADQDFDYSFYDRDGNGIIAPDELTILVLFYQDGFDGFVRALPDIPTSDGVTISGVYPSGPHVYGPDVQQAVATGLLAHELSHVFIDAGDMYENASTLPSTGGWDPTAPGPYSLMDNHTGHEHLDPAHKLYAGDWYDPIVVTHDGYYEIAAIETAPQIYKLADPASHAGEYFLVENRQRLGYDGYLPDTGLAIWHIDEHAAGEFYRRAVEIEPACGPTNPLQWANYLFDGAGQTWGKNFWDNASPAAARWHDGTPSRIGVWAIPSSGDQVRVYLDVPGPGLLVDIAPEQAYLLPGGTTNVQVRLVNTGLTQDTFVLSSNLPAGWASWSQSAVTLASYQEQIVTFSMQPPGPLTNPLAVTIAGASVTNPAVQTQHSLLLQPSYRVDLPFVVAP